MLKHAAILLLLVSALHSQCTKGCLSCGQNAACVLCDGTAGYYLDGNTCTLTSKANCALLSQNNVCVVCQAPGYYLDATSQLCVAVPSNATVSNCAAYSGPNACQSCQNGFYPTGATNCTAVTTSIPNCLSYDTLTTCSACSKGFKLNTDRTGCVAVTVPSNCALVTQASCLRCKSGFSLAANAALAGLQPSAFSSSLAQSLMTTIQQSQGISNFALPVCYGVTNCIRYSPVDFTCTQCQSGYSYNPSSGVCFQNPLPRVVQFCATYQTATTCAACISGYVLTNPSTCVAQTQIANCLTYNPVAPTTQCLTCAPNTYLTQTFLCAIRTVWNLPGCATYSPNSDTCATCNPSYRLTSDSRNCLFEIANCLTYATSGGSDSYFICLKCADYSFSSNGGQICSLGTVTNCRVYVQNSNTCLTCVNGFRLSGGQCVLSSTILGCSNYSNFLDRKCDKCVPNAAKFTAQTGCTLGPVIANCRVYQSSNVCAACNDGYQTISGGTACGLVNAANCAAYMATTCVQCNVGFVFNSGNCVSAANLDQTNCEPTVLLGTYNIDSSTGCRRCNSQSVPWDRINTLYCLPTTVVAAANSPTALDANCQAWKLVGSTYVCIKCATNFFVLSGACVASCSGGTPQQYTYALPTMSAAGKYNYAEDTISNVCSTTFSVANCAWVTPLASQTTTAPAYGCAVCSNTFLTFVSLTAASTLRQTAAIATDTVPAISSCAATTGTTILGQAANTAVPSCAYYFSYPTYNKNACLGCNFGFTGPIRTEILNCVTYTGTSCLQCRPGFFVTTGSLSCTSGTNIPGCNFHDARSIGAMSCIYCNVPTHYRTVVGGYGTCTARTTITGCTTYHENQDVCIACGSPPVLVNGACYATITNCKNYGSLGSTPFYECTVCDHAVSYINIVSGARTCTAGAVSNCAEYSQTAANTCLACTGALTLFQGACVTNSVPSNANGACQTVNGQSCTTCWKTANLFTVTKFCTAPATINNCAQYVSTTACGKCNPTFYLQSPTSCVTIPANTNCVTYVPLDLNGDGIITTADYPDSTTAFVYTCETCKSGYYYNNATATQVTFGGAAKNVFPATCQTVSTNVVDNCATNGMNNDGTYPFDNVNCVGGCAANFHPYSFDGLNMCIAQSFYTGTPPYGILADCKYYKRLAANADYKCQACNYGFGLDVAGNGCMTTCPNNGYVAKYVYSTANGVNGAYRITARNMCISTLPANNPAIPSDCAIVAPNFLLSTSATTFYYVCIKCISTSTPLTSLNPASDVFNNAQNYFSAHDPNSATEYVINSPLTPFNEIKQCIVTTTLATALGGQLDVNCEQYGMVKDGNNNVYTCNRCKDGYVGTIVKLTNAATTAASVHNCAQDTNQFAAVSTPYTGFNTEGGILSNVGSIRSIFSVYSCVDANKVVVAFMGFNTASPYNNLGFVHYIARDDPGSPTAPSDPQSLANWAVGNAGITGDAATFKCLDLTSAAVTTSYLDTAQVGTGNVIDNCQLYIINTNAIVVPPSGGTITVSDPTTRALICVACKPGYKPTYSAYSGWTYISACTAITNCPANNFGTMFNVCSTCPFTQTAAPGIDYYTCSQTSPIANCLLSSSADATKCALCLPGFLLKADGSGCVSPTTIGGCTDWQLNNPLEKALTSSGNSFMIPFNYDAVIPYYTYKYFGGCATCANNYQMINMGRTLDFNMLAEVCIPDALSVIDAAAAPFNVANCQTYAWIHSTTATVVGCVACTSTGLLRKDSATANSCPTPASINNANTANCVYYDAATNKCLKCSTSSPFIILNGLCTAYGATQLAAANCKAWDFAATATAGALRCAQCVTLYTLVNNACATIASQGTFPTNCGVLSGGACTACTHGYVLVQDNAGTKSCLQIVSGSPSVSSVTPHDAQCLTLLGSSWNSFQLECTECNAGFYPVAPSSGITAYCYVNSAFTNLPNCAQFTTAATYGALTTNCARCVSNSGFFLASNVCSARTTASTGVTNCLHYTETADTCMTCNTGFTINSNTCAANAAAYTNVGYTPQTSNWYKDFYPNVMGYMESCTTGITDCTTGTQYLGLAAPLAYLFSCHKCSTTNNIPIAYVYAGNGTFTQINGLFSWGANATSASQMGYYENGLGVACLNPTVANNFHPSYTGKLNFPSNCALGIINVWAPFDASMSNVATNVDRTKIGIMCVACPPGYKPTTATDTSSTAIPSMVAACTQIANCQTATSFNKCDACTAGNAFQTDANGNVDRTTCWAMTIANCQLFNSALSCALCTNGYYLNLDGVCEVFNAPNCQGSVVPLVQTGLTGTNIIDSLFMQIYKGCTACAASFTPTQVTTSTLTCIVSNIKATRTANPTKYTANCQNYFMSVFSGNNILCDVCNTGWVVTTAKTCITTTDVNCIVAVSASVCNKCKNNSYMIINGLCVIPNIANCIAYSPTITNVLTCVDCAPTYALSGNQCVYGSVPNCAKYVNPTTCYQCMPDWVIRRDNTGAISCVASPVTMNCLTMDDSLYNQYLFNCLVCNPGFWPSTTPFNFDYCYPFNAVDNCVTYDIQPRISLSTYKCTACSAAFYLNTGTNACVARTAASLNNCLTANPTADTCLQAVPAPTVPTTTTPAAPISPQPAGIPNCVVYDSLLNCIQCSSTTFFNGTWCVQVAANNLVPNCVVYNGFQNCVGCANGYFLRVGFCLGVIAKNCATVNQDRGDCATCLAGYAVDTSGGFNNCTQLTNTNCIQWSAVPPFPCTLCASTYGLFLGVCSTLNQTVANCLYHLSDGVCFQCNSGYSLNGTASCVLTGSLAIQGFTDPNCDSFNYAPNGVCYLCQPGYTLNGTTCIQCSNTGGCLICDPNSTNRCLLCQSGFYADGTGACISNTPAPPAQNNSTNNQTDYTPNGVARLAGLLCLLLCLLIMA